MADPTQITQQQVGFAPEVAPYAQDLLGRASAMMDLPYQEYAPSEQVAQFSPLQQQSYDYAEQLKSAPQLQDATALAGQAGLGGLNAQYTFNPYGTQSFTDAGVASSYMSPYMQGVVDVQQQQAKRQADIAAQTQQAQAARSGAFGGGRDAIMRSQANAELQRNLQGIQATGLQNAYQQGMQQFNTEQQQRQAAAQLNAQQGQFGASLGMQGLQTALQGAGQLGNLGQTQYAQNVGLIGLQNQLGLQQQQQAQNLLNVKYQNWLAEQNMPYKQMGFMSDILRGAPLTTTGSTVYQAAPTALQSLSSLGLGAYGLSSLFGGQGAGQAGKAAGGSIKGYAGGGSVTSREFKEYAVDNVPSQLLPIVQRNAQARNDRDTYMAAIDKMAEDAAIRRGIAGALPAGVDVVRAAGGGIVAFAGKGSQQVSDGEGDEDWVQGPGGMYVLPEDMDESDLAGALTGSEGSPELYTQALRQGLALNRAIGRFAPTTMTPEEEKQYEQSRYNLQKEIAGPNEAAEQYKEYLKSAVADRGEALRQAKGIGALRAMSAMLQPGGFMRGIGAAGAAFGESYGKALEADRAEKRALAAAKYNLADAERKERMGFTKSAMGSLAARQKNLQDADRLRLLKLTNQAQTAARIAQAGRPVKTSTPKETPPKEYEVGTSTYLAEIKEQYPDLTPAQQKAKAFERYQQGKSAGLPGVQQKIEATAEEKARERAAKRATTDQALNTAIRKKDSAAEAARRNAILQEELSKPVSGGGSKPPPLPEGFVPQR